MAPTRETRVLTELIATVASSLELAEVMRTVVRLMSEGSGVHACFVYLIDPSRTRLDLKAASEPYEGLVGTTALRRSTGIAWWVAEHREPVFLPENAPADPRFQTVAGIDEDRFQSFVCVPLLARSGDAIGVVTAHTEAPREFTRDEVDFLVSSASLVAGAIENARLYEETRARVQDLERLVDLGEAVATATTIDELVGVVGEGAARLLRASRARVYLLDAASEELVLRAAWPDVAGGPERLRLASLGPELARGPSARVSVPFIAGQELLGLLVGEGTERIDLARGIASQAAVAIKKVQLIEHLTERNRIKDFFDDLTARRPADQLEARAGKLGIALARPHAVLAARHADAAVVRAVESAAPGALCDLEGDELRALVPVPEAGIGRLASTLATVRTAGERPAAIGISGACLGAAGLVNALEEARQALVAATVLDGPGVRTFDGLGAYRYLLPFALDPSVRDPTLDAVARLAEYDRRRGSALLATLEEFLRRHGSISATAEALYVHQNTLRQRLRRIAEISGLDLRRDDWLAVELAVRMTRLRLALAPGGTPSETDT